MSLPPFSESLSESITGLEFELLDSSYFFVGLSGSEGCRVQLEHQIRLFDGTHVAFFKSTGCTPESIFERATATELISDVRIMYEDGAETLFRIAVTGGCVVEAIEGVGAIPQLIVASEGVGRITAEVPRCVDPRAVIQSMARHHPNAELVARRKRDRPTPTFTTMGITENVQGRLTERQWEVLRTAFEQGYYSQPREHTGEEIAGMLGISSPTFSQHLRSAHRNLLTLILRQTAPEGRGGGVNADGTSMD